jgi:hypothetical protein
MPLRSVTSWSIVSFFLSSFFSQTYTWLMELGSWSLAEIALHKYVYIRKRKRKGAVRRGSARTKKKKRADSLSAVYRGVFALVTARQEKRKRKKLDGRRFIFISDSLTLVFANPDGEMNLVCSILPVSFCFSCSKERSNK